jgi:hypothetical protein
VFYGTRTERTLEDAERYATAMCPVLIAQKAKRAEGGAPAANEDLARSCGESERRHLGMRSLWLADRRAPRGVQSDKAC